MNLVGCSPMENWGKLVPNWASCGILRPMPCLCHTILPYLRDSAKCHPDRSQSGCAGRVGFLAEDWGGTNKQRVNIDRINHDKWVGHRTHIEFRIHWCSKFGSRQTRSFLPNYEQLTLARFWRDYPKHPKISQNFVQQDAGFDVLLSCYKGSACSLAQTLSVNRIQHK
jgi:hypothetical protein